MADFLEALAKAKALAAEAGLTGSKRRAEDDIGPPPKRPDVGRAPEPKKAMDGVAAARAFAQKVPSQMTSTPIAGGALVMIPSGVVGTIIGRGGEKITQLQTLSGANIQVQRDSETQASAPQRALSVMGTPAAVQKATEMIEREVQEYHAKSKEMEELATAMSKPVPGKVVRIPNSVVGLIIGKGGETIKDFQARSTARIQVEQAHDMEEGSSMRRIMLSGTDEAVAAAEKLIMGKAGETAVGMGGHSKTLMVPDDKVGVIIGKGGCVIKDLQVKTGAHIKIPQSTDGRPRTVLLEGTPQGVMAAEQLIMELLMTPEQRQASTMQMQMAGGYANPYGMQAAPAWGAWGYPPYSQGVDPSHMAAMADPAQQQMYQQYYAMPSYGMPQYAQHVLPEAAAVLPEAAPSPAVAAAIPNGDPPPPGTGAADPPPPGVGVAQHASAAPPARDDPPPPGT